VDYLDIFNNKLLNFFFTDLTWQAFFLGKAVVDFSLLFTITCWIYAGFLGWITFLGEFYK